MAASFSAAAAARDTSQGVSHYRDFVLRYWYSRARAARRAMYITTPLRGGTTQRNKRDFHLLVDLKEHGFQLNFINLPLPLSGKKYTNESSINKTHTDIFVFLSGVKKRNVQLNPFQEMKSE